MSDDTHEHPHASDDMEPRGHYQYLADAVRELLIEKGIFSADDMRRAIEAMDVRTPAQGARVVAHAWVDPAYKARLLANGTSAVEELGVEMSTTKLVVVENTPKVHNVIVCTLCSCYPRMLLGVPPAWYKSRNYRSRVVREPRTVLAEFGTVIPDDVDVHVHDSTAEMRYLVLPMRPDGGEDLSEEELATLVTRDTMVGVAQVPPPK
ncbi:MAG: nitrile hydratase subunit alpha [Acidiferrobacterales bacterium]